MNSTFSFKQTKAKQLARQGSDQILSPKQTRRPLPRLLILSFFYEVPLQNGTYRYHPVKIICTTVEDAPIFSQIQELNQITNCFCVILRTVTFQMKCWTIFREGNVSPNTDQSLTVKISFCSGRKLYSTCSVVDPNTLNLDPDPGLYNQF